MKVFQVLAIAIPLLSMAGIAYTREGARAAAIEPGFYETLEKLHGHTCAGSLMGARLGLAAKLALKAAGGEGKLKAKYFSLSCPVDGIQYAAGTTYGNKAIEVVDQNEHRLLLSAEKNGRQVEARLTKPAEEKAKKFRELKCKVTALPVGSPERQRMEKYVGDVIAWFKTAPDVEVVQVRLVK